MSHPRFERSAAIILSMRPFGEQDKIIDVWAEKSGRMSGIAKSAQKSRKRFGGRLDYFSLVELHYQEKPHSTLHLFQSCELLQSFEDIKQDIHLCAYASYLCELILKLLPEKQADEGLFTEFVQTLDDLSLHRVIQFKIYFMKSLGLQLLLDRCCQCKRAYKSHDSAISFRHGGLLCISCRKETFVDVVLSKSLYDFLMEGTTLSAAEQHILRRILNSYLEYHYGYPFRSFEFLSFFEKK